MSKISAHIIVCFAIVIASGIRAQQPNAIPMDSATYKLSSDSTRTLDSAYRARKAQLDTWIYAQRSAAHPQEDFISLYLGYGGYLQILPSDLNQFFSERVLRSNPQSDRNSYSTVDRAFILGLQAQLTKTWGIYFEYDLTMKWFNTTIDSISPPPAPDLHNTAEELDLTEHSFIIGGMFMIYSSEFYRLRANGGIGGVIASTSETETPGNYARSASAIGYQINFDILNDFRVAHNVSFTIDLLTRSVTTSQIRTSSGYTLDLPFGARTTALSIKPRASNVVYGIAAGLVFYF